MLDVTPRCLLCEWLCTPILILDLLPGCLLLICSLHPPGWHGDVGQVGAQDAVA